MELGTHVNDNGDNIGTHVSDNGGSRFL